MNERRSDNRQRHQKRRTSGDTLTTRGGTVPTPPTATRRLAGVANADPREKALYRWTNVVNLDVFLQDVYLYYLLRGFWSILLRRLIGLVTVAFVVGFSLFLTQCIDYSSIKNSTEMFQILVPQCTRRMGFFANALLWGTTFTWICKACQDIRDIQRLRHLHDFYLHLLDVSDSEIQSIEWQEIVSRLMALRDSNPTVAPNISATTRRWAHTQSKQRMDAHDIANRLMRRDNYMIAMINKDILDMTLPMPLLRNRQLFTRTLEWNLNWCIMDFVFNSKGQIRPLFLKETHRKELAEALRRRFLFAGTANLIIAPFLIIFILIQNFFTYFNEYQKNPSSISSRQYNVFAEWKFREFNELWHLFKKRINMSHPFASRYVDQFPKDKTIQAARFVTFISGAVISVLGLATVFDQENFLSFEITHGRTTLFYIGLFGGVWAVARGMIPEDSA
ncbi:MAG: autophagy protein atg9, partial [Watsoniomyces obsoletus]